MYFPVNGIRVKSLDDFVPQLNLTEAFLLQRTRRRNLKNQLSGSDAHRFIAKVYRSNSAANGAQKLVIAKTRNASRRIDHTDFC